MYAERNERHRQNEDLAAFLLTLGTRWTSAAKFISGKRTPDTHYTEGWVGLRSDLDSQALPPPRKLCIDLISNF